VVRTRVGYTGGTTRNPTYHDLGDHTETLELDFDPAVTTYEQLLTAFWSSHDPARPVWSRQYMAAVFYHHPEQERLARETAARQKGPVNTAILPAETFYLAEEYHQKYYLQSARPLMRELRQAYPDFRGIIHSTAATRVNGYLAGHGDLELLEAELPGLGLSPEAEERLRVVVTGAAAARKRWG
jgi:methionine-S-sulfoxide reductase